MHLTKELNKDELIQIAGGESFAYRAGQFVALATFKISGVPSYGAIKADQEWFG